jgi:hypothetical protein
MGSRRARCQYVVRDPCPRSVAGGSLGAHRREEARAMTYGVATFEPAGLIVTAAGIAG